MGLPYAVSAGRLERWRTVFLAQNTPSESKKIVLQAQHFDLLLRVNDYVECVNCKFGRCDMTPSSPGLENNFVGIVIEKCIMNVASSTDGDPTGLRHVQPRTRAFSGDLGASRETLANKHSRKGFKPSAFDGVPVAAHAREPQRGVADTLQVVALALIGAKGPPDGHHGRRYAFTVTIASRRGASAAPCP